MAVVYLAEIMTSGDSDGTADLAVDSFKGFFKVQVYLKIENFFVFTVQDSGNTVKLHNTPMNRRIRKNFKTKHCKLAKDYIPERSGLAADSYKELRDVTAYRLLIGPLFLLANTVRTKIASTMSYISQFMLKRSEILWKTAKHLLRYLSGTDELGTVFTGDDEKSIRSYSDTAWGSERPSRKPITGTVITFAGSEIHWHAMD